MEIRYAPINDNPLGKVEEEDDRNDAVREIVHAPEKDVPFGLHGSGGWK